MHVFGTVNSRVYVKKEGPNVEVAFLVDGLSSTRLLY